MLDIDEVGLIFDPICASWARHIFDILHLDLS